MADFLPLAELAPMLGRLVWFERTLFELEGRWSTSAEDPALVVHLARWSRHHGAHAEMLDGQLPTSPALDARSQIAPPGPAWVEGLGRLEVLDSPGTDGTKLRVLVDGLLPIEAEARRIIGGRLRDVADRPLLRALAAAGRDHDDERAEAAALLAASSDSVDEGAMSALARLSLLDQK